MKKVCLAVLLILTAGPVLSDAGNPPRAVPHEFGEVTKRKLNENFYFLLEEVERLRAEVVELRERTGEQLPEGSLLAWDPIIRTASGQPTGEVRPLPSGWRICNGTAGTPQLADRFLMGVESVTRGGEEGGSNTLDGTFTSGGAQAQTKRARTDDPGEGSSHFPFTGHSHLVPVHFDNRPMYYGVIFLCRADN